MEEIIPDLNITTDQYSVHDYDLHCNLTTQNVSGVSQFFFVPVECNLTGLMIEARYTVALSALQLSQKQTL